LIPAGRLPRYLLSALTISLLLVCGAPGEMKVPLWVQAGDAQLTTLVPPEKIHAWFEDTQVVVRTVHPANGNLVLLIVLDVVGDLTRIDAVRAGLVELLADFGPREFVGLLRAQDGLQVLLEPTNDHKAVQDALLTSQVSGFPGLLDSVEDAAAVADQMLRQSDVRVAVLYITDGSIYEYRGNYTNPVINPSDGGDLSRRFGDSLVQERINGMLKSLMSSWAPLFFLHLENRGDRLNAVYQNGLTQFAQTTGGQALFCESVAQIQPFLEQIIGRVRSQQVITVETPPELAGQVRLRLEVEGADITYRERFDLEKPKPEETK
jgi:hypothetical protein